MTPPHNLYWKYICLSIISSCATWWHLAHFLPGGRWGVNLSVWSDFAAQPALQHQTPRESYGASFPAAETQRERNERSFTPSTQCKAWRSVKGSMKTRSSFLRFRCSDDLLDPAQMFFGNVGVHSRDLATSMTEGSDPHQRPLAQERPSWVALRWREAHVVSHKHSAGSPGRSLTCCTNPTLQASTFFDPAHIIALVITGLELYCLEHVLLSTTVTLTDIRTSDIFSTASPVCPHPAIRQLLPGFGSVFGLPRWRHFTVLVCFAALLSWNKDNKQIFVSTCWRLIFL